MTEIQNIPYFDGHCDTIWRCMKREAVPDYGATEDECRAYFSACAALRENRGHVDLLRGQHYRKRAQFFALYDDVRALPPNTAWTKLREMHDWFLSQIQENSDLVSRCKTGAEVDTAAAQHRTAALLSVETQTISSMFGGNRNSQKYPCLQYRIFEIPDYCGTFETVYLSADSSDL